MKGKSNENIWHSHDFWNGKDGRYEKEKWIGMEVLFLLMLLTACSGAEKQSQDQVLVSEIQDQDIAATISSNSKFPVQSASPTVLKSSASQNDKIQHIQDIYNRIVREQSSYRQSEGHYYTAEGVLVKAAVTNGNTVLDKTMQKNGYTAYSLEYYYEDWIGGDNYPIFIYAVIDKKEYGYYFCQGEFIRRVGPEGGGNTNDSPIMNTFVKTLRDEGKSYRDEAMKAVPTTTETTNAGTDGNWSHADKVAYIDGIYERITGYPSLYPPTDNGWVYGGNNRVWKAVLSNGYLILDDVMKKNGYTEYTLECYYDMEEDTVNKNNTAMLVHAWINGKEYWYYFFNDEFIRRIGPERGGNCNDTPKMNDFIETLRDECAKHRYICGA